MKTAATLSASILAAEAVDDERFFEATALLATRFDRRSEFGDLRSDPEAPRLLFDWFDHADSRVPDFRVWDLTCQINDYFDPDFGLYLPGDWPWDTRDRALRLSAQLRGRPEWAPVLERALVAPDSASIRAISCCVAERVGVEPYPAVWAYLCEHVDNGYIWHLVDPFIDEHRLPSYLAIARMTLLPLPELMRNARGEGERGAHWHVWWEVLGLLQRFPGQGIELIEAGMRSHDAGVRMRALDVLTFYWRGAGVPPDTITLARQLSEDEPDETVQGRFDRLLQRV